MVLAHSFASSMEPHLLEGERGNLRRVPSRIDRVGVVREGGLLRRAVHSGFRGRVDPLHFVEDDPLVRERGGGFFQLVVPSFLSQHHRVALGARVEHGVEVDVHKVVKVLGVLRSHRLRRKARQVG